MVDYTYEWDFPSGKLRGYARLKKQTIFPVPKPKGSKNLFKILFLWSLGSGHPGIKFQIHFPTQSESYPIFQLKIQKSHSYLPLECENTHISYQFTCLLR